LYALREAVKGMNKTRSMTALSILTITLVLIILSVLAVITLSAHGFLDSLLGSEEINVFLGDDMTDADMLALDASIAAMDEVAGTRIITKEDAAVEMAEIFNEDLLAGLETNPLPRSIVVTMSEGHRMSDDLENVAIRIRKHPSVESVEYGREWMSKIDFFFVLFLFVETTLGTLIVTACLLIISNTVTMAVLARREMIEIMRLVGATDGFIRRPFYYEGLLQGLISGIASATVLYGLYLWIHRYVPDLDVYFFLFNIRVLAFVPSRYLLLLIVPIGGIMGFLGSVIAVRRAF